MSVHLSWDIKHLKKHSTLGEHSDIVYEIGWICSGINTAGLITFHDYDDTITLKTSDLSNPIPYASLTKDVVIGWVKDNCDVNYIEDYVMGEMTIIDNDPDKITTLPWD